MDFFAKIGSWFSSGLRRMVGMQYNAPTTNGETAEPVTFDSAMQITTVWACVKLLAETVSSLPLTIYKVTENGRKVDENHPLSLLFNRKPNRYQTRVEFFESVILNLVTSGNGFCLIDRLGDRITSLMPLMSAQMEVELLRNGSIVYKYTSGQETIIYPESRIWHLKLMGNGIVGMSPLQYHAKSLGIAQAAESAVTKILKNGGKRSGVFKIDKWVTPDQREILRASYNSLVEGDERLLILEGGTSFDPIALSPQDIELLESRKFQKSELCGIFGVPSIMINDTSSSTVWGSGISQIVEGFYKLALRPLIEKIEVSILCNLMTASEASKRETEFDFNALTRSDLKTRFDSYRIGIYGGFMKPNEARRMEGWEDADGGDLLFMQGANVSLEDIANGIGKDNNIGGNNGN